VLDYGIPAVGGIDSFGQLQHFVDGSCRVTG
jgi:hypothetical protein